MDKPTKTLSDKQTKFLASLFGESEGNFRAAMRAAEYSEMTTVSEVIEPLRDEIIQHANSFLAANAPKAVFKLVSSLDQATPNANVLKAISMILDRVGIRDKTSEDIQIKVPTGGIFILPAKEVQEFKRVSQKDEDEEDSNEE